jgi:hypothetical protein
MPADKLSQPEPSQWRDIPTTGRRLAPSPLKGQTMLGTIAIVLLVLWLLGFFAFHVTAAAIHIILVIAVVLIVLHFLRGRSL